MNPLHVAIVGCGRISDLHQVGYQGREDARIVAVCDTRKSRAKQKAKAWGVKRSSPVHPGSLAIRCNRARGAASGSALARHIYQKDIGLVKLDEGMGV